MLHSEKIAREILLALLEGLKEEAPADYLLDYYFQLGPVLVSVADARREDT